MEYTDIAELREAASGYLFLLQHHEFGYKEPSNESVTRLHHAIANVDLGEIGNVLAHGNVNQHRIIEELVEPTLSIMGELTDRIGRNMAKIRKEIDPKVDSIFDFCKAVSKVLRKEFDKLKSRRCTDPTFADEEALQNFHEFGLGSYGDISFDDFIKEYIIKNEPRIAVFRRLNYLISQSSDEQVRWELRKYLYWHKCDEDAIRELHDAFVDFYRFYDHAANVSPIPSKGSRDEVTTRLFSVLEWCKQHDKELKTQLVNCPLLKDVEDLSVLATYICDSFNNWSSIVGNDTITIEIVNDVAMMLDNVIAPTIKQRNPTSPIPEPTPEPQPSPSVQATEKDDATLPDFSHMESYTPTIPFNMSALYSFLIGESVISNIDETLFTMCITHAHLNEVWKVGNHHKLKCVFRHVKDHFPKDWIDIVAQNLDTTRKKITAFQRDKIGDFERKLRDIV